MMIEKAKDIAQQLNLNDFKSSRGWISRFKQRHSINTGVISGTSKSVNVTSVEDWLQNIWPVLKENYEDKDIFNADETGLFYKCTPNTTLKFKGEKCTGGKLSKERLTILLNVSSIGEKTKPLIIGKYKNPRCFKNKNLNDFEYQSNKKAWMTSEIFISYLSRWDSELRRAGRKVLLILDNCSSHPDINSTLTNIKLVFLPPNVTSILQPCDQGIIKNFKYFYRKLLVSKLLIAADKNENFNIDIFNALCLVKAAWEYVLPSTIKNCFFHSKIISLKTDNNVPTIDYPYLNEHIPELFETNEQIEEYLNVDDKIELNEGVHEENYCYSEVSDDDIVDEDPTPIESISINDCLKSIETLKNYYMNVGFSNELFTSISNIEKDICLKYLKRRKLSKNLFDYQHFIKKND